MYCMYVNYAPDEAGHHTGCRLLAGGIAGMASRAAVAPFERMRTMYMADRTQTSVAGAALLCRRESATFLPAFHDVAQTATMWNVQWRLRISFVVFCCASI